MTPAERAAIAEAIAALDFYANDYRYNYDETCVPYTVRGHKYKGDDILSDNGKIARVALASLRALARAPAEETGEADPFRNADPQDWKWLYENLGDGGRGKFWKAVFDEFHHIRLGRLARIASGEEEKS